MKISTLNKTHKLVIFISLILVVFGSTSFADDLRDSGEIKYLHGPRNAEDMLPLGDTQWLITSGLNGQASNTDDNGHIYLVNHREKTFEEFFSGAAPKFNHDKEMFSSCPGPINPDNFSTHGLALQQQSSRLYRLYIINHVEREAIEVFNIDTEGQKPAISWVGCVVLPEDITANSVAILTDGGFFITKYFDPTVPDSISAIIQGKITGGVLEWHPGGNVEAILGTELSGANGIALSRDNEWVYVTAFGTRDIARFNRTKNPITMEKVKIDIRPDNIRWGDDGMLYVAGNNYVPPEECQTPPCRTGWSVFSIHPETLELKRITGVDQTATMQNATTALVIGDEIWVGTFSGDKIGYLPKP